MAKNCLIDGPVSVAVAPKSPGTKPRRRRRRPEPTPVEKLAAAAPRSTPSGVGFVVTYYRVGQEKSTGDCGHAHGTEGAADRCRDRWWAKQPRERGSTPTDRYALVLPVATGPEKPELEMV